MGVEQAESILPLSFILSGMSGAIQRHQSPKSHSNFSAIIESIGPAAKCGCNCLSFALRSARTLVAVSQAQESYL